MTDEPEDRPDPVYAQKPLQRLKRGDVVRYGNFLYFFQPNGTYCYLYHNSEDIGVVARRVLSPLRFSVYKASPDESRLFIAQDEARIKSKPVVPARKIIWDSEGESSSDSDDEQVRKIIQYESSSDEQVL